MKKMKKIFALLLALTMVLGMSTTVFAAGGDTQNGTGTITVNNTSEKAGKYTEAADGKFKFDTATNTYVQIKEGENYTGTKYKYEDLDNAYTAYRIFQASPADNGDDKTKPTSTWGGDGKNTVSYTATAAQVKALSSNTDDVLNALAVGGTVSGANGCFTFTKTANGDYVVTLGEDKKAADVAAYFNANYETLQTNTAFESYPMNVDATSKKATATVPYGYYFISSSQGAVVSVDTTNNNVVINDKNSYADPFNPGEDDDPTDNNLKNIVKINGQDITVDHDNTSANIGDILEYEIKNNTSNYVVKDGTSKKVSYVYINDTIGKGLKYVTTRPFTVKVGNAELTRNAEKFTVQDPAALKYYIIEKDEATGDSYDGDAFTVIIPWLDANGDPVFADNAVVTVNYSAQLDEYVDEVAGNEGGANSSNKADVKYDLVDPDGVPENPPTDPTPGQGGTETGVKEDEVRVFVYAIAIQKYDGADNTALEGAHFQVKLGETVIGAVPVKEDGTAAGENDAVARYMYDSTNTSSTAGYTTDFVTNSKGQIIIYGVKQGTYTVTETNAPAGYNLMTGSANIDASVTEQKVTTTQIEITKYYEQDNNGEYKKVVTGEEPNQVVTFEKIGENETVDAADRYKESKTETADAQVVDTKTSTENVSYVTVENNKGSELPSTGGIGTTIFYVMGSALVVFAGVMLVTRRRMSAN